jgi:hypothetical protein
MAVRGRGLAARQSGRDRRGVDDLSGRNPIGSTLRACPEALGSAHSGRVAPPTARIDPRTGLTSPACNHTTPATDCLRSPHIDLRHESLAAARRGKQELGREAFALSARTTSRGGS